jgi:signal transduction histidine kinase
MKPEGEQRAGLPVVQTELLSLILDQVGEGVAVADENGRFALFNPAAEKILGIGPVDVPPSEWTEQYGLFLPDCKTPFPTADLPLARAIRGEQVDDVEMFIRHAVRPNGLWLSVSARPIRDAAGALKGGVASFRDVTARKRAEEALQARLDQQAAVAELGRRALAGADVSAVLDLAVLLLTRMLRVEFVKVLELQPDGKTLLLRAGIGWNAEDIGRPAVDAGPGSQASHVLLSGGPVIVEDWRTEARFPEPLFLRDRGVLSSLCIVLPGMEGPFGLLGVDARRPRTFTSDDVHFVEAAANILSVTLERRRADDMLRASNANLERSNRELQEFASVASHDLQEPLRKIQAFGDRLRTKYEAILGEQGRDYLQRMQAAAGRMQSLIIDLLTFSRVATRAAPFLNVDLHRVIRGVLSDLESRLQQTGGRVEVGELPTLEADSTQMRQLLQNLIGNALKFHRPGALPIVRVHGRRLDGEGPPGAASWCEIAVEDDGIGFDEKYLDRIFNVFQRLHGHGEYEGTGMGLAICRKIVQRHGGFLTAHSAPDQGATFLVTMPMRQPHGTPRHGEKP